jgi:tetratricopeptide (TPR) repeat protein
MKRVLLTTVLMLAAFAAAGAQVLTSETTRKAGELLARGDRDGAIAVLDAAIEKRKDLLEAFQMRASLRMLKGDVEGAVGDYSSALELSPNDARLYEQRARTRALARDHAGALKDYDSAIANGLKSERVFAGRAAIKRDMGDADGAIADYQAALAINPELASAENGLVFMLEHGKNDPDAALAHLQGFLDRYEEKRGGKLPHAGGELSTVGSVMVRPGGDGRAASQLSLTAMPGSPLSSEDADARGARFEQLLNLAVAYANLGRMYEKRGEFDRALASYEKGLRVRNSDPYLHRLRGELRIKRGDLRGAIEDLKVATDSPQAAPDVHLTRGLLLILQGKDAEAEKEFAVHLQAFPTSRNYLEERREEAKKLRSAQESPQ